MVSFAFRKSTIYSVTLRSEQLLLKEKKRWQIIFEKHKTYGTI